MPSYSAVYRSQLQHNNVILENMKRILYIALALVALYSCEKADLQQLTLVVDKTVVEASGQDHVTFQLLDSTGVDILTDRAALQYVNIVSEEGVRVPRMDNKASFIANGTYNFKATYRGQASGNTVQVVAQNRGKYEKFHKNVAIYKATGTWCPACPGMTAALESMNDDAKAHSVQLSWHSDDDFAITMGGANDCGALVAAYLSNGTVAFPTVVLDLQEMIMEKSSGALENAIWNLRAAYPATCGIKVSAKVDGTTGKVEIDAELTSATGGEYDLGCALLLNDQEKQGGTAPDNMYTHIVRASTPNYLMYSTSIKEVEKDGKIPFKRSVDIGSYNPDDLSVVVYALVKEGEGARIDNIVEVKVGESLDYIYNE